MDTARAIEVVADAARRELRPLGVGVAVVQAGFVASPIIAKTKKVEEALHATRTSDGHPITEIYPKLSAKDFESRVPFEDFSAMSVVSDAVHHALTSARPQIRH